MDMTRDGSGFVQVLYCMAREMDGQGEALHPLST